MRTYAKVILGVLVIGSVIGGIGWGLRSLYDAGGDAREAAVRLEYTEREKVRNGEIIRLQQLLSDQRSAAEAKILAERKTWETRINALKNMDTDCMPPDVLGLLRDAGIYTGPIPCK